MVGHEEEGHKDMWPYNLTLINLTDNPTMSATELANDIVINYKKHYFNCSYSKATISAVSLANITELCSRASDLAITLQQNLEEYRDNINSSRRQVQEYGAELDVDYVDVYHLAELLKQNIENDTVQGLCQQIKQAVNATIIREWHRPDGPRPNSHGFTIYFPDNKTSYEDVKSQYNSIDFCQEYLWDEFLKAYLGVEE